MPPAISKVRRPPAAAGLSLKRENVERFRQDINAVCTLTEQDMAEKVAIDMELPFSCVTEEFLAQLELLEPLRQGESQAGVCQQERGHPFGQAHREEPEHAAPAAF